LALRVVGTVEMTGVLKEVSKEEELKEEGSKAETKPQLRFSAEYKIIQHSK
jgi:hypothetical protein